VTKRALKGSTGLTCRPERNRGLRLYQRQVADEVASERSAVAGVDPAVAQEAKMVMKLTRAAQIISAEAVAAAVCLGLRAASGGR
jgi:hypothetical protein